MREEEDHQGALKAVRKPMRKPMLQQILYHMERALVLDARNAVLRTCCVVLHFFSSGFIALIFQRPKHSQVPALYLMAHLAYALIDVIFTIFAFGREKAQIAREVRSGTSVLAYFCARNALLLFDNLAYAGITGWSLAALCRLDADLWLIWLSSFALLFFSTSFGMVFSALLEAMEQAVVVACVLVLMIGGVLSGANPSLPELQDAIPGIFNRYYGLPMLSFARWSVMISSVTEWEARDDLPASVSDALLKAFGYSKEDFGFSCAILFGGGLLLRSLSFCLMAEVRPGDWYRSWIRPKAHKSRRRRSADTSP